MIVSLKVQVIPPKYNAIFYSKSKMVDIIQGATKTDFLIQRGVPSGKRYLKKLINVSPKTHSKRI